MLDNDQVQAAFQAARHSGFEALDLFSECTQSVAVAFRGRTDSIEYATRRGTALHGMRGNTPHHVFTHACSADAIKLALQDGAHMALQTPWSAAPAAPAPELSRAASAFLQQCRRAFSISCEIVDLPEIRASFSLRTFLSAAPDGQISMGHEQTARLHGSWRVLSSQAASPVLHQWECVRSSFDGALQEMEGARGLWVAVKASTLQTPLWPAPLGPIPVLWAPRAVAKIQALFLRAFEGDRVLGNRSWLASLPLPQPLAFILEERPGDGVDHEGATKRPLTFFRDGRPTALACNRRIASELDVPSTGHARRESYETPATVAFWHMVLEASPQSQAQQASLLDSMERGVSIHDIDVLHHEPASGRVILRLHKARLVHHGQEGEPIEPINFSTDLVTLLGSFEAFGNAPETTGISVGKQGQSLITEVTTPAALSGSLPLPGTVPLSHYW